MLYFWETWYITFDFIGSGYARVYAHTFMRMDVWYITQMINEISWTQLQSTLKIGEIVTARVTRHAPYGIFVDLNLPFEGIIQINDFKDEGIMLPQEYPQVGQEINAVVLGFKEIGKQIWLGVRPSQLNASVNALVATSDEKESLKWVA